ncbi:hypothetical protein AMELA_G00233640 [Ameiurus melas]|uniref:Lactose synthase B protein n=1 Tax=Ameiurus melas TaxID=219545 RepID=A0A7J6A0A5_AMEME|nr:hypothetical protein AMELA_G00233640 [Ameiurus melas]
MGIRIELEMLAVLLLLTPIVIDGLLTSKCELANQLMSAIPADVTDRENLVAKIVCHAEETSGFDTSIVNQANPLDLLGRRKTRAAPNTTRPPKTTKPPPQPRTPQPMFNETEIPIPPPPNSLNIEIEMNDTYPPPPPNFNSTYMNHRQKRGFNGLWTLYGVFQLADRVACTSSKGLSVNICNMDCSKLTDDDLTDDINCVWTIINSKPTRKGIPGRQEEANKLIKTMNDILMNTCANRDYSQYLVTCIAP